MRKVFSLLAAAVFISLTASAAFAQFVSVSSMTKTAKVVFTSSGEFSWNIDIRNVSGDGPATEITWDAPSITPGTTGWVNAQQYILITSTVTDSKSAIQVYTDNVHGSAYVYTHSGSTDTVSAGGLVGKNTPSLKPLSMGWSMKDVKGEVTVDPTSSTGTIKYASVYFKDKSDTLTNIATQTSPFQNGEDYVTIINSGGWKWGGGERGGSPSGIFYMYIGADFSTANTPNDYGTDTLTFEGYTE
ncbi:MAG: hypothetical protein FWG57_00380 [Endomicrobia bacterium]|jgi:hypothetical protein|nr:hypothetical protein [Endomicrobiia bacterium]